LSFFALALFAGKLCSTVIRSTGLGQGSNLPGRVARRIDAGFTKRLSRQSRYGALAISGTNGKSTSCGFASSILSAANFKLVHNRQGANLATGIATSLLDACNWQGKLDADYCLFEIDEASLPVVAREAALSAVVVTNLFRDQLDRFGELDTSAKLIDRGVRLNSSTAILNADDPNVAQLGRGCPRMYFGIESVGDPDKQAAPAAHTVQTSSHRELAYCPNCEHEFVYSRSFFGQLGHYFCPRCGYSRPEPEVKATEVLLTPTGSRFSLVFPAETVQVSIPLPGLYNVYNALAAAALAHYLRLPALIIKDGLENYNTLFGRTELIQLNGSNVLVQLIKNPAGASQVLQSITQAKDSAQAPMLIAINDNFADGRDVSWLWDADFEQLEGWKHQIIVSGQRAPDMAVRLKYAGIPTNQIIMEPELKRALKRALSVSKDKRTLYVLPTYTCLLGLQKIFKSMGYLMSGTR
jgi:lipid II isoglutaminyl synthase (glutamine-hydrolysing)